MSDKTSIGDRMKTYEVVPRIRLTPRMPTILRIDGKAFSTFTRGFDKPWDLTIRNAMTEAAKALMKEVQGAKIAYIQSDEISILINDYEKFDTDSWFDKDVQKMASVSASIATAYFNKYMENERRQRVALAAFESNNIALFDSRCFILGREEVCNLFLWRQQDATRNSISGLAHSHFSHKQLHKKNTSMQQEMLFQEKGINWNDCETWQKRGWCVTRETKEIEPGKIRTIIEPDWEIPVFSKDRDYINQHLVQVEE